MYVRYGRAGQRPSYVCSWQRSDYGQLDRPALEAQGFQVVLAKQPTVVAGHAMTSGQITRVTDFETPPATARIEAALLTGALGAAADV